MSGDTMIAMGFGLAAALAVFVLALYQCVRFILKQRRTAKEVEWIQEYGFDEPLRSLIEYIQHLNQSEAGFERLMKSLNTYFKEIQDLTDCMENRHYLAYPLRSKHLIYKFNGHLIHQLTDGEQKIVGEMINNMVAIKQSMDRTRYMDRLRANKKKAQANLRTCIQKEQPE